MAQTFRSYIEWTFEAVNAREARIMVNSTRTNARNPSACGSEQSDSEETLVKYTCSSLDATRYPERIAEREYPLISRCMRRICVLGSMDGSSPSSRIGLGGVEIVTLGASAILYILSVSVSTRDQCFEREVGVEGSGCRKCS